MDEEATSGGEQSTGTLCGARILSSTCSRCASAAQEATPSVRNVASEASTLGFWFVGCLAAGCWLPAVGCAID